MPDSEVSKYKTKAFIARDGSMKVWMVENTATLAAAQMSAATSSRDSALL